ncbi:hypothetical protein HDU83_005101 [Entophlyctis luteolus]|nr:hypothetical protein HDU83_005101 [Entophlyctis luteolus]
MSWNQAMADAMRSVTKAMMSMNKSVNLPELTKIMMDFERESDVMDMKEEMMNDAIDDNIREEDDEAESDEIVNQILDEIGVNVNQAVEEALLAGSDSALQERLNNLYRD